MRAEVIIGTSAPMRRLAESLHGCVQGSRPVVISGEDGTGKHLVAREIHRRSRQCRGPFVTVSIGTIDRQTIANSLFGSRDQVLSSGARKRDGWAFGARGGTLLLAGLSAADDPVQFVLPKVVELLKVGCAHNGNARKREVRVIATLNPAVIDSSPVRRIQLDQMFQRLDAIRLELAPLRERTEDIPLLVEQFIREAVSDYGLETLGIRDCAMDAFRNYAWPGNVRELKHVVIQAASDANGGYVDRTMLPSRIAQHDASDLKLQTFRIVGDKSRVF